MAIVSMELSSRRRLSFKLFGLLGGVASTANPKPVHRNPDITVR